MKQYSTIKEQLASDLGIYSSDIPFETARRACMHTSFDPDKRGIQLIKGYSPDLVTLKAFIDKEATDPRQEVIKEQVFEDLRQAYKKKYLNWIGAKSRCLSTMITGPANFPVSRAEKANRSERNRSEELSEFASSMESKARKRLKAAIPVEEQKEDELNHMRTKLKNMEAAQEYMKLANKAFKEYSKNPKGSKAVELIGQLPEFYQKEVINFNPEGYYQKPFMGFNTTNNLANIKRTRGRVIELEQKAEAAKEGPKDIQGIGMILRYNYEVDRMQLLFDDMPSEETRTLLKKNGFRWSPRFKAWQRKITNNAIWTFKNYVKSNEAFKQYLNPA